MSQREDLKVKVKATGADLTCRVCSHDRFLMRETLMNTPGATFFGVEWANKSATTYICAQCGYVHWFMMD